MELRKRAAASLGMVLLESGSRICCVLGGLRACLRFKFLVEEWAWDVAIYERTCVGSCLRYEPRTIFHWNRGRNARGYRVVAGVPSRYRRARNSRLLPSCLPGKLVHHERQGG